jgi:hypothetical protein
MIVLATAAAFIGGLTADAFARGGGGFGAGALRAVEVVAALCAILLLSWDHRPRRRSRRVRLLFAIRDRPSGLAAIFGERPM